MADTLTGTDQDEQRLEAQRTEIRERMKGINWHLDEDDFVVDSDTGELVGPHPDVGEYWGDDLSQEPPELYASIPRRGGRPKSENPKKLVTMRLDTDLVERLKADGKGWQTRANTMLRKAVGL